MKIFVTLLLLNFTIVKGVSQNPAWVDGIGGAGDDSGISVITDASSNVYTTGYFEGTVDFDPGAGVFNMTAVGSKDIFISKLNASGNFQWSRSIGGVGDDRSKFICSDPLGNLYVTGSFSGTVDFDPGAGTNTLASVGDLDIFILKIDNAGNLIWAKSVGSTNSDYGASIALDNSGNIYTTGHFAVAADFDPGAGVFNLTTLGAGMFFLKLDPSGNFIWAKAVGCPTQQGVALEPASIVVDAAQNVYTTGHFTGLADFDPGIGNYTLTTNWNLQTYICKLNASGNFVWAKNFEGNFNFGYSLVLDAFANVYVGGFFGSTADFDPGAAISNVVSAGGNDAYIVKLDSSGNFNWAKSLGGTSDDAILALTLDASGNIYATGDFKGTADFDAGPSTYTLASAGDFDAFITRLDPSGNFIFAKGISGPAQDSGLGIALDAFGNILLTGFFNSTCDFDSGPALLNLTAVGGNDAFIFKLGSCTFAITSQPSNQTSAVGGSAQFVTSASYSASLFQWQQNSGSGFANLSDGGQYSGVTTASLTISNLLLPQNNFSFRCIITAGNCINVSDSALLTVLGATGINELSSETIFSIYPNPSKNFISVKINAELTGSAYSLTDQTGRALLEGNLNREMSTLDISNFAAGLYFLKVNGLSQKAIKVVKE